MSDPMTRQPASSPFEISALNDPKQRLNIEKQLQGKRWRMRIAPTFVTGYEYGFLEHPDFAEPVFFHLVNLESNTDKLRLAPGVCLEVEVKPGFNQSKKQWNYTVSYGRIVDEDVADLQPVEERGSDCD